MAAVLLNLYNMPRGTVYAPVRNINYFLGHGWSTYIHSCPSNSKRETTTTLQTLTICSGLPQKQCIVSFEVLTVFH